MILTSMPHETAIRKNIGWCQSKDSASGYSWTAEDAPIALIVTGTSFAMVLQKLRKN
jgi:hypothetical protein